MTWRNLAACRGCDPDLWYPEESMGHVDGTQAKAICRACPVQSECLIDAIGERERRGIWGGLSYPDRRKLARMLGQPAREPAAV